MLTSRPVYFILTLILFTVELLIALFVNDSFVRPYGGDYLVVILLYCFVRSFFKIAVSRAAAVVLLIAFLVEIFQGLQGIRLLGWQNNRLAKTVLGTSFEWTDLLAYVLGIVTVLLMEKNRGRLVAVPAGKNN
ncbi:MAG: DUF2809 domain-containing protein [Chitinophagaceae bacterium]|nr:MAG: DUF2809 domain-containing protein [Chitinophagaceae bacterium]